MHAYKIYVRTCMHVMYVCMRVRLYKCLFVAYACVGLYVRICIHVGGIRSPNQQSLGIRHEWWLHSKRDCSL